MAKMLVRDAKRVLYVAPAVVLVYLVLGFLHGSLTPPSKVSGLIDQVFPHAPRPDSSASEEGHDASPSPKAVPPAAPKTHHEIVSLSTKDGSYFKVDFGPERKGAINPNIIAHPVLDDLWVIVAQAVAIPHSFTFTEIVCYAAFDDGALRCQDSARDLPIAPTKGPPCPERYKLLDMNEGPHDARVFYGPQSAYTIYGTNSRFACFGQFIQSFPDLMEWKADMVVPREQFPNGTEIERPGVRGQIEKNWFVFWDKQGQIYAHYDMQPRVFAKLGADGSVGADLAPAAAKSDDKCLEKSLPALGPDEESIHQASNSLSITLCKRADPSCRPDNSNTVIFTVFHHKRLRGVHSTYEPYVMAFRQESPFELYGISKKPIWIRGRRTGDEDWTEMLYVTSISWKARSQRYHGYLDDQMFLGFGIEDADTGGIDILAGDLLAELSLCSSS